MTKARLILFTAFLALWPTQTQAANGWWAWLEELSGPGPFRGEIFSVPVTGWKDRHYVNVYTVDETVKVPTRLVVRVGWFRSLDDGPRFDDRPATEPENQGVVHVLPASALILFRTNRAIDVGFGGGVMRFSGKHFNAFYRVVLTPANISLRPFVLTKWEDRPFAKIIRVEVDTSFVTKGFKGSDFGNPLTSFKTAPEFLTTVGVILNLEDFVRR